MADSFSNFESFKSEVAQRTRKALMEQQQGGSTSTTTPRESAAKSVITPRSIEKRGGYDIPTHRPSDHNVSSSNTPRSVTRPKSALVSSLSRGSLGDKMPVSEHIPDRHKYTPKSQKEAQENRKPPGSGSVSKRLLQLAPNKTKTVNIFPNDGNYNKAAPVHIVLPENLELLLNTGQQRLNLPSAARHVYRARDGKMIHTIDEIQDEECIVVAIKEAFKPQVDTTRRPRHAPAVQSTRALRMKIESTLSASPSLLAGSPSAEVKVLLSDPSKLLRRFRLSYNTGLQKDHAIHIDNPRTLENVRILCGLGAVSLRNQSLASLRGMMIQPDMVELYMQNNMLSDLDHSIPQPKLKDLRLENNFIVSFRGFVTQPKLESVWLDPNPICLHPHYRLMVSILQNNNYLVRIDDSIIDREDRLLARALAPYVADALRAGWLLDTEPAVNADYDMTVEEFQLFHRMQMNGGADEVRGTLEAQEYVAGGSGSVGQYYPGSPEGRGGTMLGAGGAMEMVSEYGIDEVGIHGAVEGATEDERQRAQIARLSDALVRANQKARMKDQLLADLQNKMRAVQEGGKEMEARAEEAAMSLVQMEEVLAKRSEQCRQLYEIVGALEERLADHQATGEEGGGSSGKAHVHAGSQTNDWVQGEGDAATSLGEQLSAERRARGAERAALENKIQRLELSAKASEASSHQGHISLFSIVRARLVSELSYSIPDSKVLMSLIQDIDSHLSEFGGNE